MAITLVLAGSLSPTLLAKAFIWMELHLLTFQVLVNRVSSNLDSTTDVNVGQKPG